MTQQLVPATPAGPLAAFADRLPPMIAGADDRTAWRFVDFFTVTIRNPNTREAYYRAVSQFMDWCEQRGLHRLDAIRPIHVAANVEQLPLSRPSVRQHLSAISRCFDWMVSGGTLDTNPATSVQRPKHVVRVGRTPVLSDDQARMLLESISIDKVAGLRDRALIATMLYTFGRVGAVIAMDVEDYRLSNHQRTSLCQFGRWWGCRRRRSEVAHGRKLWGPLNTGTEASDRSLTLVVLLGRSRTGR